MRCVHLCVDEMFWATKCEVRLGHGDGVAVASRYGADKWFQKPSGVHLAALWDGASCKESGAGAGGGLVPRVDMGGRVH